MTFPSTGPAATLARRPVGGILAAFAAAFAFALYLIAQPAAAQEQAPAASQYSEEQIEAFASATLKVQELNAEWIPRIAEAQTPDENAALREEAMQEMREAVRDEGLSVEQYNGIHSLAQRDPTVMQMVEDHRNDMQ